MNTNLSLLPKIFLYISYEYLLPSKINFFAFRILVPKTMSPITIRYLLSVLPINKSPSELLLLSTTQQHGPKTWTRRNKIFPLETTPTDCPRSYSRINHIDHEFTWFRSTLSTRTVHTFYRTHLSLPLPACLTNSILKGNISQPTQSTSPTIISDDISSSSTEHCMYSLVSSRSFHIHHLTEIDHNPSPSTSAQPPPNPSSPTSLVEQSINSHPEPSEHPIATTSHVVEDPPILSSTKKRREKASSGTTTTIVSVGSVIPKPTKCFIDPDRISGCSDELLRQVTPHFTS